MPRLFVDISAHGFGHLAQAAPVLNALHGMRPDVAMTLRCALPLQRLAARIGFEFTHLPTASDFGFRMIDALRVDHAANRAAYREFHARWSWRVADEAKLQDGLGADFVLSDVAYLPLAGAQARACPAAAMCSLNWADLFAHFYQREAWAEPVLAEIREAYRAATFIATCPAMPTPWIPRVIEVGPTATLGTSRREALRQTLGIGPETRVVLVALGGIPGRVPLEHWLGDDEICWIVPAEWALDDRRCRSFEDLRWPFGDVLASADALVTKPGYGSFTEAACGGIPVAFIRREEWPEQEVLIAWLLAHGRAVELLADPASRDENIARLASLWTSPSPLPVPASGAAEAAAWLAAQIPADPRRGSETGTKS